ncbi:MAG: DUF2207 domain-containing protein [Bacilli bacterium]|nr:DUF2207 domain-containing protein [Bacilli bacterium]
MKILQIINLIPIIFLIISYILWNTYGRDTKIKSKYVSKLPPIPLPLISLIHNGSIRREDIILLILDLSNKGYIKIEEESNNNFKLTKIKDHEERKSKEAKFLKELFSKNNTISLDDYINMVSKKEDIITKEQIKTIESDSLVRRFKYMYKNSIELFNQEKNKYYEIESDNKKIYLVFMLSIILFSITIYPFYVNKLLKYLPFALLFSIGTLALVINFVNKLDLEYISKKQILFCTFILIVLWLTFLLPIFSITAEYLISYFIATLSIIVILVLYRYMPKRTILGTRLRNEIEGYKTYLKDDNYIKEELKHNKYFLYELLPYSYIFGINDELIKLIKENNCPKPKNYYTGNDYTPTKYYNSINRFINTLNNVNR